MTSRIGCSFMFAAFLALASSARADEALPVPLKLPPGLVQSLPVEKSTSFFGDALRAVHCPDDKDNPFGTCGNLLFGGLVMSQSHVSGTIHIRFYPPVRDVAHFEVTHPGGLLGDDSYLTAPQSYRLPVKFNLAYDDGDGVSSGDLNLLTGEVTNLTYRMRFVNSALTALVNVNPKLEAPVIEFPGTRGTAIARFEQRPDGLLDYSFYGSAFLPLGNRNEGEVPRFPLSVCDLHLNCASIPCAGTSRHPHIRISTKPIDGAECGKDCAQIPYNTVQEYTAFTCATYFGDKFTLNIPELGGGATGRSHLLGRIQVQFGEPGGGSVPFAISSLVPAGLLAEPPETPLSIPGLSLGMLGHDEILRFPLQTYYQKDVAFADEPFDLQVGAIDLRTGRVIGDLVYRGFIAVNVLFKVLEQNDGRIAPNSWQFRGPARFERGANGQTVFRFDGATRAPFSGFRYPSPDFVKAHSWVAGEGSFLDPFLKIQAMSTADIPRAVKSGSASSVSSLGDAFSYSYSIPCSPAGQPFSFEYTNSNSAKGGTFKMYSLANVHCTNSRTSTLPAGDYDTATFSGFGTWSRDKDNGIHVATIVKSPSLM